MLRVVRSEPKKLPLPRWAGRHVPHIKVKLVEGGEKMGFFSKDIKTFNDLFVHMLRDIYYAENQIAKALQAMIEKTTDRNLSGVSKSIC